MRTFVDRGGTFTDVVTCDDTGHVSVRKVRSDEAIVGTLKQGDLTFGTTVATNALLEGRGVRVCLLVTKGFADLAIIGDQTRPDLFDSDRQWTPPTVTRVIEVEGRIDAEGNEVCPLQMPVVDTTDIDAVAIVLMNSHRNPVHERALAQAIDAPFICLGHQVSPECGYLSRIETSLVDAAFTPVLREALVRDQITAEDLAIRSDGSLCPAPDLRAPEAVLSGPAGGVLAVAAIAESAGFSSAVGLDMGGTSTDVCRVDVGSLPLREDEVRVAGVRIRRPMFEVETIAAGGGSILVSDGRRLSVGPESAGAHPGPQCYGRGGPPTLTDAALAEGLVDATAFSPPLDPTQINLPGDAGEFLSVAREAMAQAIRRLALSRGKDLRDHALVAYGGAAGQHAAFVAELLHIRTVLVHPCAAVLSAWGQALAVRQESAVRPLWIALSGAEDALREAWSSMGDSLPAFSERVRSVDLRYEGTDHAIEFEHPEGPLTADTLDGLAAAFHDEHHARYGFSRADARLELVNARVRVRDTKGKVGVPDGDPFAVGDHAVRGPLRLDSATTSVWVPPGWEAHREGGILRLERIGSPKREALTERTPYGVALWANRFQAVAEEGGEVLKRLARSVNIKERCDFSVAIFDPQGELVANAPHIPVHLGAMGETVRDLIAHEENLQEGTAWLTNDPAAGGSHLPDLTVVTPVLIDGLRFFVASRGHHADVGGVTPGSMPPHSRLLAEEGTVFRREPLTTHGQLRDLLEIVSASREAETVAADLEAQIAANRHAGELLRQWGSGAVLETWMGHLADVAAESLAARLSDVQEASAEDHLDGIRLKLSVTVQEGRLKVDFSGTEGPHPGNLNAPFAVTRAAVLYALRVMVGRGFPLNDGALRHVDIICPVDSILMPPETSAVVGGNVETSQRLVDLLLNALRLRAASQGTMNNLTLGGDGWSLYETVGGGLGASSKTDGVDGRQVHMTNTRATDPEVLEARLPLRLWSFAFRQDSGGLGHHRGGHGLVRQIEVLSDTQASLLATRRDRGAPGLLGGSEGLPGRDMVFEKGQWRAWDGKTVRLSPGDRIRIETPGGGGWGVSD